MDKMENTDSNKKDKCGCKPGKEEFWLGKSIQLHFDQKYYSCPVVVSIFTYLIHHSYGTEGVHFCKIKLWLYRP